MYSAVAVAGKGCCYFEKIQAMSRITMMMMMTLCNFLEKGK
jgi:hypothetical protein